MNRVALTKVVLLGLVAAAIGLFTGLAVWLFLDRPTTAEIAKVSVGGAALAVLFLSVTVSKSPKFQRRLEPCPGCGMELSGLPGQACSRCGLVRQAKPAAPATSAEAVPCRICGYDLAGLTVQACPECGTYLAGVGTLQTLLSRNLGLSGWCACCGDAVKLPPGEPCPRCHSRYRSATKPVNT